MICQVANPTRSKPDLCGGPRPACLTDSRVGRQIQEIIHCGGPCRDRSFGSTEEISLRQPYPDARQLDFNLADADEIALFLADAAVAAGPAVMDVYEHGGEVWSKGDGSPVTLADKRAEAIVCESSPSHPSPSGRRGGVQPPLGSWPRSETGFCSSIDWTERKNCRPQRRIHDQRRSGRERKASCGRSLYARP